MPEYRRAKVPGGTYFFTVITYQRGKFLTDEPFRHALREGIALARKILPFAIEAWVLLPDHLHCIWRLPQADADYARRWAIIKRHVSRQCGHLLAHDAVLSESRLARKESAVWQRRYWEHQIRDEADFARHVDYIHYNPVKHGYVKRVADWPYSSFHRLVQAGMYPRAWAGETGGSENGFGE